MENRREKQSNAFWQQWMVRSGLLVPETWTHTTRITRHATFSPGFSLWSAEIAPKPLLWPWLRSFPSSSVKAIICKCWSRILPQIKLNECWCQFPTCQRCTHPNTGAPMVSTGTRPGVVKAPGEEYEVLLDSSTFFRDPKSTRLPAKRLQKPKYLQLLTHWLRWTPLY